jgi:hypothetical protein
MCKMGVRRLTNGKENEVLIKELQIVFLDLAYGLRGRRREESMIRHIRAAAAALDW